MKKEYIIPKCPECKKPIIAVNEIIYEYYDFDKKTGSYFEKGNGVGGSMDIKCGNCGADVSDIFEEGACNYQTEKK